MKIFPIIVSVFMLGIAPASLSYDKIDQGVYFGLHTGADFLQTRLTGNSDGSTAILGENDVGDNNPNVGIFAGYSWIQHKIYLAGELGYTYANTKILSNLNNAGGVGSNFSRPGYVNGAALLGYCVSPETVLYIRLGTAYGRFRVFNDNSALFAPAGTPLVGSKNTFNFLSGVGLQTHLVNRVMVRLEWTREYVRSVTGTYPSTQSPAARIRCDQTHVNSLKIGVVYKMPL
jgi:opacity protein-like surface antigen